MASLLLVGLSGCIHIFITVTYGYRNGSVERQKGVGETEECLMGRYNHMGKNGVGLHREDVDEYDAACSDKNGER